MKATIARLGTLTFICFGLVLGGTLADSPITAPEAVAAITQAKYCFARSRGLDPGHLPPSYLVLQLAIRVSYRNSGLRPLILPLERERTIYTALKPGTMSVFRQRLDLFEPAVKPMKELPVDVSPDSPVGSKNDAFTVVPARGEMILPLLEDVTLPVDRKVGFNSNRDLRGHRVYLRLKFEHQDLAPALDATLSDRWARFGIPWTGTLLTNTVVIDVPQHPPQALPCVDEK